MGCKAIFTIVFVMTCEIAVWIVLCECYAPKLVKLLSQLQSLDVNEPLDWSTLHKFNLNKISAQDIIGVWKKKDLTWP